MKGSLFPILAAVACLLVFPVRSSAMELDGFLAEVNVTASADLGRFRADLSASFGVSSREIDALFEICDSPADVYMTLRIGEVARVSIERVVAQYRVRGPRGWGAIAKSLGIKPGSPEFHALKKGRLGQHARGEASATGSNGSPPRKGKGHK